MSLVHLSNLCSHLTNASRAHLSLTSLPLTTQLHALLLQLQKHGYVNTVAIAGPLPPPPSALSPIMSLRHASRGGGEWGGHVAPGGDGRIGGFGLGGGGVDGEVLFGREQGQEEQHRQRNLQEQQEEDEAEDDETQVTRSNISTRRLWVGLKYYNSRPVLSKMSMVSKPTRRVWMPVPELEGLVRGERRGYVRGLRGVGEGMFASTDRGVMEVREAVERRVGGMLLCRVNGV